MSKSYDMHDPKTTADAVMTKHKAQAIRQKVRDCPDSNPYFDKADLEKADRMDAKADAVLALPTIERGMGGELIPPVGSNKMGLTLTLKQPDKVNLEASLSRAALADDNGVLVEALDAAESMGAQDAAEQMLCHQIPALHRTAMELIKEASHCRDIDKKCKMLNTAARMMDTFQKAMVTVKTYRRGGEQIVKHIHIQQNVQVQEGGQAVVNGSTETGGNKQTGEGEQ